MIGLINNSVSASPTINITYNDLNNLKASNLLVIGQQYCIIDYKITYQRPIDVLIHTPETVTVENAGKIYITAKSVNTFFNDGFYFNEILNKYAEIKFNFNIGVSGHIWYMKDEDNNQSNYDHWNITFARWYDPLTNDYTAFPDNGNARQNFYTFSGFNCVNNNLFNETVGPTSTNYLRYGYNNVIFQSENINFKNPYYRISIVSCRNIEGSDYASNLKLKNINLLKIGKNARGYIVNDLITNNFYNEIGNSTGLSINIIGEFKNNKIGNSFSNNTINITGNFNNNILGDRFKGNNIQGNFNDNVIGSLFSSNVISNNFNKNRIGNYFFNNEIGLLFENNQTAFSFTGNSVNNECQNNNFGNYCNNNTIGSFCSNNYVFDDFGSNTIGDYFNWNTIKNSCSNNNIADYMINNDIGNSFQNNTIADSFAGNIIANDFYGNNISFNFAINEIFGGFYSNYILEYFTYNKIFSQFHDNTIGTNYFNNQIKGSVFNNIFGNSVENNVINNNFNFSGTSNGFKHNTINHNVAMTDFTTASLVYGDYNCTIFKSASGNTKLSYYNNLDLLTLANITD